MNDKREILGWTMYDWANSAFSTTVVTALLGPYIESLASSSTSPVMLFGLQIEPAAIYPFTVSLSVLIQVLFLPLLGTIADFTNLKKRMMMGFAYTGATATMLLFIVQADMPILGTNGAVLLASFLFIVANLSFGAAIVFYNAFLPEIASADQRDIVSSQGFAVGYVGGGLLLLLNLILLSVMEDTVLAVRLSLASAGLWWLVFTYLFPQQRLVVREPARQMPEGEGLFRFGVKRVLATFREMWTKYPETLRYLIAYLIYNDGIQTVIAVAALFASSELGIEPQVVLLLVLMIQFVAFGGALLFGWLAGRIGAKKSILLSLVIWSVIVIYAYLLLINTFQLFVLGFFLALVLGGSQALSRSLFSQMIPRDHEAEYFGFYEISERGTSWIGTLFFGLAVTITGSQRVAILTLIVFFLVGLALLSRVDIRRAMLDSGNDPEGVVI
ncbi:MAG: MFS transporter [Ardenticatenaceae bacterium]|nr:MFS transporter [Ardenticatenaceae bacterium]